MDIGYFDQRRTVESARQPTHADCSVVFSCARRLQVEYLNPGGTSKDRVAASMIAEAEASGALKEGGTVVEGTSGSTGICLTSLCRAKGYRCLIVMPDDQVRCHI